MTIIGHLVAPILAIDRAIQRAVDTGAFALMRRGVSKGQIRYMLWMGQALGMAVDAGAIWRWYTGDPWAIFAIASIAALYVLTGSRQATDDARADARGMLSPHDASYGVGDCISKIGLVGCGCWALLWSHKSAALFCTDVQIEVARAGLAAINACQLVLVYLRRTPRRPPPKRDTQPISATFNTAGAES